MITKTGIYPDLSDRDYFSLCTPEPALTASTAARMFDTSPFEAWMNDNQNPDYAGTGDHSTALHFGTIYHAYALLDDPYEVIERVDFDDWRSKVAKDARDDAKKRGKTAVNNKEYFEAMKMIAPLIDSPQFKLIRSMETIANEVAIIFEKEGVWNKIKPDSLLFNPKTKGMIVVDLKSQKGVSDFDMQQSATNYHWWLRSAHYIQGVKAVYGEDTQVNYIYLCQSKSPPHLCRLGQMDGVSTDMGFEELTVLRKIWRESLDRNTWPGYQDGLSQIMTILPQRHLMNRLTERQLIREEEEDNKSFEQRALGA